MSKISLILLFVICLPSCENITAMPEESTYINVSGIKIPLLEKPISLEALVGQKLNGIQLSKYGALLTTQYEPSLKASPDNKGLIEDGRTIVNGSYALRSTTCWQIIDFSITADGGSNGDKNTPIVSSILVKIQSTNKAIEE